MGVKEALQLIASELEDGETLRTECPQCGESEGFVATRQVDKVLYICHRASCSLEPGMIKDSGVIFIRTNAPKQKIRRYERPLEPMDPVWLENRFGWDHRTIQVSGAMWAPRDDRVAYPVFGPLGLRRGWMLRSYNGATPKCIMYKEVVGPSLSWYVPRPASPTVFVVEDIPSAVTCHMYDRNAVAINSSGIGWEAVEEIRDNFSSVVWAFDADNTMGAIEHHRKYGGLFNISSVRVLDKDIKDMNYDERYDFFGEGPANKGS